MNYADAIKKVRAEKPKENFLHITLDLRLVLPHKDGLALIQALANAEHLPTSWSSEKIRPLRESDYTLTPLSHAEWEQHKVAALLNCTVDEVKNAERLAKEAAATTT